MVSDTSLFAPTNEGTAPTLAQPARPRTEVSCNWKPVDGFGQLRTTWLPCRRMARRGRGHHDGVAPDEWVAHEYARVRRFYAKLNIPEKTEIEFFNGRTPSTARARSSFSTGTWTGRRGDEVDSCVCQQRRRMAWE